jgi:carbonic anhydrase
MLIKKVKILSTAILLCSTSLFAHESPSWSYVGDNGPKHWAKMDTEFLACSEGIGALKIQLRQIHAFSIFYWR